MAVCATGDACSAARHTLPWTRRDGGSGPVVVVKEMGISHREFFRTLPRAMDGFDYGVADGVVRVRAGDKLALIQLGPETVRSIASMRLPATRIEFTFSGYTDAEARKFLDHFDLHFRRGGG